MKKRIIWSPRAQADIRQLDIPTALRIFAGLARFAETGVGDVKALEGEDAGTLRLRIGDYRLRFTDEGEALRIHNVKHRREAYR